MVFHTLGCLDVDLRGEVAFRVDLVVHGQGRVLRVTEILLGVGLVNAVRESLLITIPGPDLLAFLTVDNCRTRILAEGEQTLACHVGIAEEGQGDILVVVARLGIAQDLGDLLVVRAAQHEGNIAEGGVRHRGQTLFLDLEDGLTLELRDGNIIFRKQIILCRVRSQLEHRLILKRRCCHIFRVFKLLLDQS